MGFRQPEEKEMETYRRMEDVVVYRKLCKLHSAGSEVTHRWPQSSVREDGEDYGASSRGFPEPRSRLGS